MRNFILFIFLFSGMASTVLAQPLQKSMDVVWNGSEVDLLKVEWSIYSEEKLNERPYFVPSQVKDRLVALREVNGKYVPCSLLNPAGKVEQEHFLDLAKPMCKKFNSGTAVWDSISARAYFTKEKKGHHEIWTSNTVFGRKSIAFFPFAYNNKAFSVAWPALSPDGQRLVFASDMPGSLGGWDLYACQRNANGWGPPQSLGDAVNSPADEQYPSFSEDGTLYFSSNRKGYGLGGFDLYQSRDGSPATALPYPINSVFDDWAISLPDSTYRKENRFYSDLIYLVSNRPLTASDNSAAPHIFRLTRNDLVEGTVEHKRRLEPLREVKVEIVNQYGDSSVVYSDQNGHFSFYRQPEGNTALTCTYPGMDTIRISRSYGRESPIQMDDHEYWEMIVYVTHKRTNSPLAGARVVVLSNEVPTDTFYTDEKGQAKFELDRIPGYKLKVEKPGFSALAFTPTKSSRLKYSQTLQARMPELKLTLVQGKVFNPEHLPVQGVELSLYKGLVKVDLAEPIRSDPEGQFEFFLERNETYSVVGKWDQRQVGTFNVTTDQYSNRYHIDTVYLDLNLLDLKKDAVATKFFYDGDPILLQAGRYPEMQSFLRYLQSVPSLKIQLEVHTDTKLGGQASWQLGKKAADFAADFFYINDIARDRVKVKSMGRSQPASPCSNCSEADHQANRRVEIRVLEH